MLKFWLRNQEMLQGTVLYNYKLTMDNKKSFGFYLLISFIIFFFLHFISVRHISLHICTVTVYILNWKQTKIVVSLFSLSERHREAWPKIEQNLFSPRLSNNQFVLRVTPPNCIPDGCFFLNTIVRDIGSGWRGQQWARSS